MRWTTSLLIGFFALLAKDDALGEQTALRLAKAKMRIHRKIEVQNRAPGAAPPRLQLAHTLLEATPGNGLEHRVLIYY